MSSTATSLAAAAAAVASRHPGLDPARVWGITLQEHPHLARLHHAGVDDDDVPAPVATTVDPGAVLLEATGRFEKAGMAPAAARAAAFAVLPTAARAWNEGRPLPAPAAAPAARPDTPLLRLRHFSTLSPEERARYLPGGLRRLAPGEVRPAGATGVEKFGAPDAGGGSFVVEVG